MYLERIREYGPNFGLYKVVEVHEGDRVMDDRGRTLPENICKAMVIGVHEIDFVGCAKGKTGRHMLNADNTKIIIGWDVKKVNNKYNVHKWQLLNQNELDEKYRQMRAWNAGITG